MSSIAIDARKYFDFGIGTYVQQLVAHLPSLNSAHTFTMYVSPEDDEHIAAPDGWTKSVVLYKKYSVGEIAQLGFKSRRDAVDIFHAPHYTLPVGLQRRSVVTIHDLIHIRFPQLFSAAQRAYARVMLAHAAHNSGNVIVTSEFTKNDLLRTFRISERKVSVIPLGVSDEFFEAQDEESIANFRTRFRLGKPFVLFVGNLKPHKNIGLLLKAFAGLHPLSNNVDLVLAGSAPEREPKIAEEITRLGLQDSVRSIGRVTAIDLVLAYQAADVLVLPSLYEGFGLPALEAMACGTPVIVSDAGSLPEIVGGAAVVFPVAKHEELTNVLRSVLTDSGLRGTLIREGQKRAAMFSWKTTAKKTLKVYESLPD